MQTSYSLNQDTAIEGQLADSGANDIATKENTGEAIPVGCFVSRLSADESCKLPAAAGDVTTTTSVLGVALSHHATESSASGVAQYPVKSAVNVLRKGRVWVKVEEAVTPASPVFVRYASGAGGTQKGAFRASADTSTAAQLAGAKYLSTAGVGALAMLELNI